MDRMELALPLSETATLLDTRALPLELRERFELALAIAEGDDDGDCVASRVYSALCELN